VSQTINMHVIRAGLFERLSSLSMAHEGDTCAELTMFNLINRGFIGRKDATV